MDLGQLRVFLAIADQGGFTRAARRLHLSPSAISVQIKRLEEELGTVLLERHGRGGATLTPAGRVVRDHGERLIELAEGMAEALAALSRGTAGALRLGATLTAHVYLLPPLLRDFRRRHPEIHVELTGGWVGDVLRALDSGRIDLALVWGPVDPAFFEAAPLADDALRAVTLPSHPCAVRGAITADDLSGQTLLLNAPGSSTRSFLEERLGAAGIRPGETVELGTPAAIKEAVLAGMGIGFLSPHAVRREVDGGQLAAVPLAGVDLRRRLVLATRRDATPPQAQAQLVAFLTERLGTPDTPRCTI